MTETETKSCVFVKDDGERCRTTFGLSHAGLCFTHDPARARKRMKARRNGAKAANRGIRTVALEDTPGSLESLEDVARWLRWVAIALATGKVDARTGSEIVKSLKELRPTLERLATEAEVKELRAMMAEMKREMKREGGT